MPELPEVEHVRRCIEPHLLGTRLLAADFRRRDLRWPIPVAAVRALRGRKLVHIDRRGKYLLLHFDSPRPRALLIHLGMTGRILIGAGHAETEWIAHEHWRLRFEDTLVRFADARRFGALLVVDVAAQDRHRLLGHLGPDPLASERRWLGAYLFARTRGRRAPLKSFLLDQSNLAGVGNIYACEACFLARLRPQARVRRLSRADCERLAAALRRVLGRALRAGGTTFRDFVGTSGEPGQFQLELYVYGRAGEPCRACGATIRASRAAGRSTFFCPSCQR